MKHNKIFRKNSVFGNVLLQIVE